MSKLIIRAAAAAAAGGAIGMSAQAAPLGGVAGDVRAAGQATAVEKAAYRRCWRRYGVRHCRLYYGYYDGGYDPYYDCGPAYGYGPGVGFFFGGRGGHFHGGHGGHHH
jgi:hypothetical protein